MLKITVDKNSYDVSTANSIKVKASPHWKHKKQVVYYIEIKYAKTKENIGLFPDKEEAEKFLRVIDYYADKRITDTVKVPLPVYKDIFQYMEYKAERSSSLSYVNWKNHLKKKD